MLCCTSLHFTALHCTAQILSKDKDLYLCYNRDCSCIFYTCLELAALFVTRVSRNLSGLLKLHSQITLLKHWKCYIMANTLTIILYKLFLTVGYTQSNQTQAFKCLIVNNSANFLDVCRRTISQALYRMFCTSYFPSRKHCHSDKIII